MGWWVEVEVEEEFGDELFGVIVPTGSSQVVSGEADALGDTGFMESVDEDCKDGLDVALVNEDALEEVVEDGGIDFDLKADAVVGGDLGERVGETEWFGHKGLEASQDCCETTNADFFSSWIIVIAWAFMFVSTEPSQIGSGLVA